MPPQAQEEESESRNTACAAGVALGAGLLLSTVCYLGLQSEAILTIDTLVRFNAEWPEEADSGWFESVAEAIPAMTTRRIFYNLSVVSICVVFAGLVGILGAMVRQKGLVCTYLLMASCLSVVVLVSAAQTSQRRSVAQGLISRQVVELCNATTYIRLATSLGCPFATTYEPSEVTACNDVCAFRVNALGRLDGCRILPRLCYEFRYERSGGSAAECGPAVSGVVAAYGKSLGLDECRKACDADIRCDSYVYRAPDETWGISKLCVLLAALEALHRPPEWRPLSQAAVSDRLAVGEVSCYYRTAPAVLLDFQERGLHLAAATALLGALLVVSACCTCFLMYNVNMKRKGLPTATELGCMMLCPCCAHRVHRKFHGEHSEEKEDATLEDEEEEDDEDDLDSAQER